METLKQLDKRIRSGAGHEVRALLKDYSPKDRGEWETIANLAWRSGTPDVGLRLLGTLVRSSTRATPLVSEGEMAEYSACLIWLGLEDEGLMHLEHLSVKANPKVLLYRALGLVSQWRYAESVRPLEDYLKAEGVSDYQRLVAQVNLLAAFVAERRVEEAEQLFSRLTHVNETEENHFLLANCYELGAANLVMAGRWREAEARLSSAAASLPDRDSREYFYIRKWKAVLELLRSPDSEAAREALRSARETARQQADWESVRDADRFLAIASSDEALFLKLYFGTPFASFREKLVQFFPRKVDLPEAYRRDFGSSAEVIDLLVADSALARAFQSARVTLRLMHTLCSDFYVPLTVPKLHFGLFPGEFFNPASSPKRVHQAILRLRKILEAEDIPLAVEEKDGQYSLVATKPCQLLIPRPGTEQKPYAGYLLKLRENWPQEGFTLKMAADYLDVKERTLSRMLSGAVDDGDLKREGKARATEYRFPEPDETE